MAQNERLITRREALQEGGKVVAGLTVAALVDKLGIKNAVANTLNPQDGDKGSVDEAPNSESGETKLIGSRALDIGTALLVAGNFGRHVLWNGAIKGNDLGPRSATEMNGLAWMRIAVLKIFGDKKTANLAGHEMHEIKDGLLPMPVLVALSDATTTELTVDAPLIFDAVKDSLEAPVDYENIKRPLFTGDIHEWEKHLQRVNGDITKKAAQIAAITSVMAPLGTTYTSSSLANDLKEEILRMLYEQSLALGVIDKKCSANEQSDDEDSNFFWDEQAKEEVRQAAYKRADELFNGNMGYSKLMFALAANTQGSWGLGDPPELYFAIDYMDDPDILLKAHAIGALNSETYTIILNAIWLKKVGVLSAEAFGEFLSAQKTTISAIAKSVTDKNLRNTSFNGNERHVESVMAALSDETDPSGKLRELLQSLPKPRIRFSLKDYLWKKIDVLNGQTERMEAIASAVLTTPEAFACSHIFSSIVEAFNAGDSKEARKMLKAMEARLQTKQAENLAVLFEGLLAEGANIDDAERGTDVEAGPPISSSEESRIHTERIMEEVRHVLVGMDEDTREDRIGESLSILGVHSANKETYGTAV